MKPWLFSLCLTMPALAVAQVPERAQPASVDASFSQTNDYRNKTEEWLIAPGGSGSVGGGLTYMVADGDLTGLIGGRQLKFTDVVMLGLDARYALGGVAEMALSTTLLPKQPSYTDELAWQSASLGFNIGLTESILTSLRFAGGPTLGDSGGWASAQLGVGTRYPLDRYVIFDGGIHARGTALFIADEAPWFGEVAVNAQLVFPAPGAAAVWFGSDFTFPVASNETPNFQMDPQTRANVMLGGVLSFIDNWDIYATFAFIDRGDLVEPETNLPILDGGFDQQQLTVGVTYRWDADDPQVSTR